MDEQPEQTEYRVVIPRPTYRIVEFQQDEMPGFAVINEQLANFEPKIVFAWHLSVMLQFEELALHGMPTPAEREVVDEFGATLDAAFRGEDEQKPNALFLARITWNATRELVYRVYNPKPIHEYLVTMIEAKSHTRPFDYRIDPDPKWMLAQWHLRVGIR
jgi:hypothetical protein